MLLGAVNPSGTDSLIICLKNAHCVWHHGGLWQYGSGDQWQEVVGNDTFKRQRRWNSEMLNIPEPQSNMGSSTTPKETLPSTTPKDALPSATLKRNFSRSNSTASDDAAPKERIGNAKYFGGGMKITASADPSSGTLEVVTLLDFKWYDFILKLHKLYNGTHLSFIFFFKKVSVKNEESIAKCS